MTSFCNIFYGTSIADQFGDISKAEPVIVHIYTIYLKMYRALDLSSEVSW